MKQKLSKKNKRKMYSIGMAVFFMISILICQQVSAENGFTVTGNIRTDFIYQDSSATEILSDFNISIDGSQISCLTDSKGHFELKNVQSNITGYSFKISKAGYLTRAISNIPVSDNIVLSVGNSPIDIWAGDLDGDNALNMSDILEIAKAFNTVPSNYRYNRLCDLNRDNSVNMSDILIVAKHFNKAASYYPSDITSTIVPGSTPVPTPTEDWYDEEPTPTLAPTPTKTKTIAPTPTKTIAPTPTKTIAPTPTKTIAPTPTKTIAPTPTKTIAPTPTPTLAPTPIPTPILDDMNYVSDTKSIHIKKYEQGTGEDKITYFVADIKTSKGSDILSAFAKDTFGIHITDKTSNMAKAKDALLAINGSYYGFREDGIEIRNGILYRDVPFRTGLAIYNNGTMGPYTEASDSATKLLENGVFQAISFGPVLVNSGTLITDFTNTVIDINSSSAAARRPIEGANPRTGIGMIEPNHFVFVVVDGRNPGYSKGATLTEFAKMFYDLGCKEAYNLDGGGSSTMYFNGKIINTPSLGRERSISDILYVTK